MDLIMEYLSPNPYTSDSEKNEKEEKEKETPEKEKNVKSGPGNGLGNGIPLPGSSTACPMNQEVTFESKNALYLSIIKSTQKLEKMGIPKLDEKVLEDEIPSGITFVYLKCLKSPAENMMRICLGTSFLIHWTPFQRIFYNEECQSSPPKVIGFDMFEGVFHILKFYGYFGTIPERILILERQKPLRLVVNLNWKLTVLEATPHMKIRKNFINKLAIALSKEFEKGNKKWHLEDAFKAINTFRKLPKEDPRYEMIWKLEESILSVIYAKTEIIFQIGIKDLGNLDKNLFLEILSSDYLNCPEDVICEIVVKWAQASAESIYLKQYAQKESIISKETHLELLKRKNYFLARQEKCVRFTKMSSTELRAAIVNNPGLVKDDDVDNYLDYASLPEGEKKTELALKLPCNKKSRKSFEDVENHSCFVSPPPPSPPPGNPTPSNINGEVFNTTLMNIKIEPESSISSPQMLYYDFEMQRHVKFELPNSDYNELI